MDNSIKEQLIKLYKDGFPEDSPQYVEAFVKSVDDDNIVYKINADNEIISGMYIVDKDINYCGRVLTAPYLVAVSTLTPMRGKRIVEEVISEGLRRMDERGVPFVMLYPFSHSYYRKYGFVTVDACPDEKLCKEMIASCDKVRSFDAGRYLDIFNQAMSMFDISISRDIVSMRKRIDTFRLDSDNAYILQLDGKNIGYVLGDEKHFEECVIANNSMLDIDMWSNKQFNVMARTVNIKAALELVEFDRKLNIDLILNIKDCFYKSKRIRLTVKEGVASVSYLDDEELNSIPTIDITTEELTLAIFGRSENGLLYFFPKHSVYLVDKY